MSCPDCRITGSRDTILAEPITSVEPVVRPACGSAGYKYRCAGERIRSMIQPRRPPRPLPLDICAARAGTIMVSNRSMEIASVRRQSGRAAADLFQSQWTAFPLSARRHKTSANGPSRTPESIAPQGIRPQRGTPGKTSGAREPSGCPLHILQLSGNPSPCSMIIRAGGMG